jgi:hypothetical protein
MLMEERQNVQVLVARLQDKDEQNEVLCHEVSTLTCELQHHNALATTERIDHERQGREKQRLQDEIKNARELHRWYEVRLDTVQRERDGFRRLLHVVADINARGGESKVGLKERLTVAWQRFKERRDLWS